MKPLVLAALWIACGAWNAGVAFRDFQDSYPRIACGEYRRDLGIAVTFGIMGPLWTLPVTLLSGFAEHGWGFENKYCGGAK